MILHALILHFHFCSFSIRVCCSSSLWLKCKRPNGRRQPWYRIRSSLARPKRAKRRPAPLHKQEVIRKRGRGNTKVSMSLIKQMGHGLYNILFTVQLRQIKIWDVIFQTASGMKHYPWSCHVCQRSAMMHDRMIHHQLRGERKLSAENTHFNYSYHTLLWLFISDSVQHSQLIVAESTQCSIIFQSQRIKCRWWINGMKL